MPIAHLFPSIWATWRPGTILSTSGMVVAPDRRMSTSVITKTLGETRRRSWGTRPGVSTGMAISSCRDSVRKSGFDGCATDSAGCTSRMAARSPRTRVVIECAASPSDAHTRSVDRANELTAVERFGDVVLESGLCAFRDLFLARVRGHGDRGRHPAGLPIEFADVRK